MDLVGDQRGQSIQIGAVLLFGVLIIAFSSYQAFVVPDQNQEVEFNHNQEVHADMQDVRNAIVSAPGGGNARSVSVELGTRYPSRAIAQNPGPPSGSLRTVGVTDEGVDVTLANTQVSGETGDYWNRTNRYNTGALTYTPQYNLYTQAPRTVYEHTVLYNGFRGGSITLANQTFIDGNEISLVMLNGSVSRSSSRTTSLDVRPVSSSTQTVRIEDDGDPLTVSFVSTRPASYWDFLENTEPAVSAGAVTSEDHADGLYNVSVELDPGAYEFQLTKVGVGTKVTDENAAYLTDTDGDGDTVTQGSTTDLTLEVRDRYNNPPDNASETVVEGRVDGDGSLQSSSQTPGSDGEVTFTYQAPSDTTGTPEIDFTYGAFDGSFDATTPQDVTMEVTVTDSSGGGGGGGGGSDTTDPTASVGTIVVTSDGPVSNGKYDITADWSATDNTELSGGSINEVRLRDSGGNLVDTVSVTPSGTSDSGQVEFTGVRVNSGTIEFQVSDSNNNQDTDTKSF